MRSARRTCSLTNPEAIQLALESGGASLVEGMRLFTEDLARGRIAMTDESAFEVGRNVGTTPGTVVLQNELMQLIQYTPTTDTGLQAAAGDRSAVHQQVLHPRPAARELLRRPRGRRRATRCSWCPGATPAPAQGNLTWDDYLQDGVLTAIDAALAITKADQANTLGFCIGGTLLARALAARAARGERPAASMTLLTSHAGLRRHRRHRAARHPGRRRPPARRPSGGAACSRAASWPRCSPRCGPTT